MARLRDVKYQSSLGETGWCVGLRCVAISKAQARIPCTEAQRTQEGPADGTAPPIALLLRKIATFSVAGSTRRASRLPPGNFRPFYTGVLDFAQTRLPPTVAEVS